MVRGLIRAFGSKLVLFCVLMLNLSGCAGGYYWKEEVVQPDGRTIEVTRWDKRGSRLDQEPQAWGGPLPVMGYGLSIPLPKGGSAQWESDRNLIPLAVVVDAFTAYLATSPWNCISYVRVGKPIPPYVFFKYEDGEWRRIAIDQFPAQINKANLLVSIGPFRSVRAIETGHVSADVVMERNQETGSSTRIDRNGPWPMWAQCFKEIKTGVYQNISY